MAQAVKHSVFLWWVFLWEWLKLERVWQQVQQESLAPLSNHHRIHAMLW